MEKGESSGAPPPSLGSTPGSKTELVACQKCGTDIFGDEPCETCIERKRRDSRRRVLESRIWGGDRARDTFTLEAFKKTSFNAGAIAAAETYNPAGGENLYFWGPTGSGKTHLAVAASRKHHGGPEKAIWKPQEISRIMRGAEDSKDEERLLEGFVAQRILIVDDLGTEKLTEFLISLLYEISDKRWLANRGGLAVTSNLDLDRLVEHLGDDRIPSRLAGMSKIIGLEGERDHRLTGRICGARL